MNGKRIVGSVGLVVLMGWVALAGARRAAAEGEAMAPSSAAAAFEEMFQRSKEEGKGVLVYVDGQTIPGVVTGFIGTEAVEMRNQEVSRVVVRLERVVAVAAY